MLEVKNTNRKEECFCPVQKTRQKFVCTYTYISIYLSIYLYTHSLIHTYIHTYIGGSKHRFTFVHMKNNTIITKEYKNKLCAFCIHKCKSTNYIPFWEYRKKKKNRKEQKKYLK